MKYALIKNGTVENVIVSDKPPESPGHEAVIEIDGLPVKPGPGDSYQNGEFTRKQPVVKPKTGKDQVVDSVKGLGLDWTAIKADDTGKLLVLLLCAVTDKTEEELGITSGQQGVA